MKKNILMILLGLAIAPASFAGEESSIVEPTVTAPPVVVPSRFESQPLSITFKVGVMHTDVGTYEGFLSQPEKLQNVPSLLYGGSLSFSWNIMQKWGWDHSLGFSVGVYTGNETSSYYEKETSKNRFDIDVWAIPLMVSYDFKKDISDSLSIYWGLRSGAMIRRSVMNGYDIFHGRTYGPDEAYWKDSDSTKIMPMLGVGAGIQMYISDKWSINLSYDFVWTFGSDCDWLNATSGTEGYRPWGPREVSKDNRYYGTVSFGATYSF